MRFDNKVFFVLTNKNYNLNPKTHCLSFVTFDNDCTVQRSLISVSHGYHSPDDFEFTFGHSIWPVEEL